MEFYSSSRTRPYQRPKHGHIETSTSEATSSPSENIYRKPVHTPQPSSSATERRSKFVGLNRYIGKAVGLLEHAFGFDPNPPLELSLVDFESSEYLGKGKTFYVSRISLPRTVGLKETRPRSLYVQPPVEGRVLEKYQAVAWITSKRPMIEFDVLGNPKQGAVEERLEATFLELRVLTHPEIYLHKNIVDFLGISWQWELPEVQSGQTTFLQPKRVPTILLEYAEHGSLAEFTRTEVYTQMNFDDRAGLCRDIAEGITVLHKSGIVHGDIKPDNILIFQTPTTDNSSTGGPSTTLRFTAKLADFGFSVDCSEKEEVYCLKGRTWPWNDPEWDKLHTKGQLEKTDVFSYGLLVWTVLSGHDIWVLFDLAGHGSDRNDISLRENVENQKDWRLHFNAATYFKSEDQTIQLLVGNMFRFALEPNINSRGSMSDIMNLWDVWFGRSGRDQPISGVLNLLAKMSLHKVDNNVSFQRVVYFTKEFPTVVKRELVDMYLDKTLSDHERSQTTVYKAFSLMMGWIEEQDFTEAKRLIDEITPISPQISIYQPMFFEPRDSRTYIAASEGACTPYEQQVFSKLMTTIQTTNSHEAFQQLMQHFPMPDWSSYSRLRSIAYRREKYGISEMVYPDGQFEQAECDEFAAGQMADIENYYLEGNALALDHSQLHYAVCSGFAEAVGLILSSQDFQQHQLEEVDAFGFTPLLSACRLGSFRIAALLIGAGANVRAKTECGETTLHFLTEFDNRKEVREVAELILSHGGADLVNTVCTERSYPNEYVNIMIFLIGTPLNAAIMRGNIPLVEILLRYGADPHTDIPVANSLFKHRVDPWKAGPNKGSPMHTAAASHNSKILKMFWETFPWSKEWTNGRLLHLAIDGFADFQKQYIHGHLRTKMMQETIDFLLDRIQYTKAPLRIAGGLPVIYFAAERATTSIMAHLLLRTNGLDVNTYHDGLTPVHIAIRRGSNDIFNLLLKYGADPHLGPTKGPIVSTLTYCCTCVDSTREMLSYLLKCKVGIRSDGGFPDAITHAVAAGKLQEASMLLIAGADLDELNPGDGGWTKLGLIVRACTYNSITLMHLFLEHPLNLGMKPAGFLAVPYMGWTLLHVIAFSPVTKPSYDRKTMLNILDYLLHNFRSPLELNAQDHEGLTALHHAAFHANSTAIRRLLAVEAIDTTILTNDGRSIHELGLQRLNVGVPEAVKSWGPRAANNYQKDIEDTMILLDHIDGSSRN